MLHPAGTHLGNGKREVRFGIDPAPGPAGAITGPGATGTCADVDTDTTTRTPSRPNRPGRAATQP